MTYSQQKMQKIHKEESKKNKKKSLTSMLTPQGLWDQFPHGQEAGGLRRARGTARGNRAFTVITGTVNR